jgi:hypothetical protein
MPATSSNIHVALAVTTNEHSYKRRLRLCICTRLSFQDSFIMLTFIAMADIANVIANDGYDVHQQGNGAQNCQCLRCAGLHP